MESNGHFDHLRDPVFRPKALSTRVGFVVSCDFLKPDWLEGGSFGVNRAGFAGRAGCSFQN